MSAVRHALVIPLYGSVPLGLPQRLAAFQKAAVDVVLVLNHPHDEDLPPELEPLLSDVASSSVQIVRNGNKGGVAGGFNRGVEAALATGVDWITLLDQDSDLPVYQLPRLREPWQTEPVGLWLVGPRIWDVRRGCWQGRCRFNDREPWVSTRLLISSGTTFRAVDWPRLGPMQEWLVVDFVDHAWSFQAQAKGFVLLQHRNVALAQQFGAAHPNVLCRSLGMELYSPRRHFYSLRNLRWLVLRPEIPLDLKIKEVIKMFVKPWLWLIFEPNRRDNLSAIMRALCAPLPLSETP